MSPFQPMLFSSPSLWTQLSTTLVVGLLIAFGLQLLLTNLGLILGLMAFGKRFFERTPKTDEAESLESATAEPGHSIGSTLGFGLLLTVNVVLFAACFLGTRFGQMAEPMAGAIAGLVIWSTYWLVLLWVSTRTLNAVAGFVFDRATGGIRLVGGAIASLFRTNAPEPISEDEMIARIRSEIETVLSGPDMRRLLEAQLEPVMLALASDDQTVAAQPIAWDATEFWQSIKTYITETSAKRLTPKQVHQELEKQLHIAQASSEPSVLQPFQPEIVLRWLQQRGDLSEKKQRRIVSEIQSFWADLVGETVSQPAFATADVDSANDEHSTDNVNETAGVKDHLQAALGKTIEYTLNHVNLPELLHQADVPVASGVGYVLAALADALPQQIRTQALQNPVSFDVDEIKLALEQVLEQTQTQITRVGQASVEQSKQIRDLAIQPIELAQRQIQAQIDDLKRTAFEKTRLAQQSAVRGLWWLFAIAATGALSSSAAGVLATQIAR